MKHKLTSDEIKQYSLLILKDIKRVCSELDLTYYLDSGTLLGAVRHNGFIPWDDDIDVAMPRPDYEKFIREYNKHCNKRYKLKSIETNLNYGFPYAKIFDTTTILYENGRNAFGLGLSVDVFTLDGYPSKIEEQKKHYENVLKVFSSYTRATSYAFSKYSLNPKRLLINIKIFLARLLIQRTRAKQVIDNAKLYDFYQSKFAGLNVCIFYHPQNRWIPIESWLPIEHQFEDDVFNIPKGFDSVLKSYYGDDYMTPPPVEKRKSTHGLEIYTKI